MTKIDIISGFLGAGKTTFIKKLLEEAIAGEQVVLIENEKQILAKGKLAYPWPGRAGHGCADDCRA